MKASEHPGRALAHPLFWVALLALLVNDHVLKQAHLLPAVVTGKLSDFAGMLVAPVVLLSVLRLHSKTWRAVACAAVAASFAAIKLSRACADAVEAITAHTPLPWRIWSDPTDLVALSMLPLAWWLSAAGASSVGVRFASCLRAAGLVLGVFACAATSASDERYVGTAFLFNGTMRPQHLRLHRLQAPLDCARTLNDPATWPGRDAFVLRACPDLGSRDILLLDQAGKDLGWGDTTLTDGVFNVESPDAGMPGPACDAVLLEAEGLAPVVITWNGVNAIVFTGAEFFGSTPDDAHGLLLEQAGERLFIKETSLLHVLPAGFAPAAADCPNGER